MVDYVDYAGYTVRSLFVFTNKSKSIEELVRLRIYAKSSKDRLSRYSRYGEDYESYKEVLLKIDQKLSEIPLEELKIYVEEQENKVKYSLDIAASEARYSSRVHAEELSIGLSSGMHIEHPSNEYYYEYKNEARGARLRSNIVNDIIKDREKMANK